MKGRTYVLMTAARNERAHLALTLDSVRSQTLKPRLWVVVSDGSTDGTDELVKSRMREEPYLRLIRVESDQRPKGFASKVSALSRAYEQLASIDHDLIGNLDADVSFEADYFERLADQFEKNPKLGLAGGFIHEEQDGVFQSRPTNRSAYVAGAVQMFRRECYDAIGGYTPARYGGEDTIAVIKAALAGWEVQAFPSLVVRHWKKGSLKRGLISDLFREGAMFQLLGSHPLFEMLKCFRKIAEKPYVIGALARGCGFIWPCISGEQRVVGKDVVRRLRQQQKERMRGPFIWHKSCSEMKG